MGTIDYTRRSAGLGNIRGAAPRQIADLSAAFRGLGNIGSALQGIGQSGADFATRLSAEDYRRREEATRAGIYRQLSDIRTNLLHNGYTSKDGEAKTGLMTREMNEAKGLGAEFKSAWDAMTEAYRQGTEYSKDTRAWLQATLNRMEADTTAQLGAREASEGRKFEISELGAGLDAKVKEATDAGWTPDAIMAVKGAAKSYYGAQFGYDSERTKVETDKYVAEKSAQYVDNSITGALDSEAVDAALKVLDDENSSITADKAAILRRRAEERKKFLKNELDKEEFDAVNKQYDALEDQLATAFVQDPNGEMPIDPSVWAGQMDEWSRDETLRKVNRERALRYKRNADEIRASIEARTAKEEKEIREYGRKADEAAHKAAIEGVKRELIRIELLRNPQPFDPPMSDKERAKAIDDLQRGVVQKIRVGFAGGVFASDEYETLNTRLNKRLDDEQRAAMRSFYSAFGVKANNLKLADNGALSASDASSLADIATIYNSLDDNGDEVSIDIEQLYDLGNSLLGTLERADPSVDREELVKKTINDLKVNFRTQGLEEAKRRLTEDILRAQLNSAASAMQ